MITKDQWISGRTVWRIISTFEVVESIMFRRGGTAHEYDVLADNGSIQSYFASKEDAEDEARARRVIKKLSASTR